LRRAISSCGPGSCEPRKRRRKEGYEIDTLNYLGVALGLLCAIGSGYFLGSSTPSWENDASIDGYLSESGGRYRGGLGSGYGGGYRDGAYMAGCIGLSARGNGLALILIIAAAYLFFTYMPAAHGLYEGMRSNRDGFLLLFDRRSWAIVIAAAIGYVYAIARDKGPVGPLE
jgi:hypothetical protein